MLLRLATIACIMTLVSACANISSMDILQNHDNHYLMKVDSIPPLKIPPGVSSDNFNTTYPIPDHNYPQGKVEIDLVPPGLYDNVQQS